MNKIGVENFRRLLKLNNNVIKKTEELLEEILDNQQCFSLQALAIDGDDLKSHRFERRKEIGLLLNDLLNKVIDEEIANEKTKLIEEAKKCYIFL